ncbi:response regulator transcription factor [Leptospira sp. GIMC2001]|uniref:response regulator transcription factor n=1 Tax=Leptospira sp. GIMC2001 TaxID=1513297 RepID=UPI00234B0BC5|nr:response regulator transcription factor [Leptospira sp. GIMC2001]WCL47801.1 response regulator transcription factor [Leptospira sp. GIMC2001]
MKNILVIEDDPDIGNLIRKSLDSSHYTTVIQSTGEEGLKHYKVSHPDLIILDLSLPDLDGMDVCRSIRKTDESTPIFILSARTEEIDRIMGLELGADDYITKPFSVRELKTRVDVFFRRWDKKIGIKPNIGSGGEIIRGALKIDPIRRRVTLNENIINISRKEFDILQLLASSPGKVFSREMILESVWGVEWDGFERMIDSHIKRIRSKLEKNSAQPEWIETIWGIGYRFSDNYDNIIIPD